MSHRTAHALWGSLSYFFNPCARFRVHSLWFVHACCSCNALRPLTINLAVVIFSDRDSKPLLIFRTRLSCPGDEVRRRVYHVHSLSINKNRHQLSGCLPTLLSTTMARFFSAFGLTPGLPSPPQASPLMANFSASFPGFSQEREPGNEVANFSPDSETVGSFLI